jgi:hypothetical protein
MSATAAEATIWPEYTRFCGGASNDHRTEPSSTESA